ncbi:transcriptional regulator [Clostridium carboxidivorans P7]|uniref:Putative transcriptional regulator, PucR family n=1 Tax=Clostridium carboxidivorans P7 TaxID=536227 RepID=C6PU33_9CLOT|nr:helix-turn-helix domain-containing protein [Clostridium carboxidivorans]AKN33847.1 transcriptional regulator [Clostridium carboxidivorans P7]EET87233.1 putative transcriptional regulator, PucR family [Clostridium carboxidivorans P7]EFG86539.1 hypothetical protein CLCAR_3486 [Clostridium carboxidivorans P7]
MKLGISILSEQLSDYITCSKCNDFSNELNLNRPEHYIDQKVLLSSHLYIASALTLSDSIIAESASCLICVGKPPEEYFMQNFSILCVSDNINVLSLFNMVQNIYDRYDVWDQRMQQCINSYSDLQDIIDVSDAIFQNPIYFSDANYLILAESHNNPLNIKYNYIPERCINNLKCNKDYEEMWQSGVPTISYHDYRHLSIVVKSQGKFVIFISIMESNIHFRTSDSALLQYMSNYVLLSYDQNLMRSENSYSSLEYFIKQYLNNQHISDRDFEKALMSLNWKIDHTYYVCYIELTEVELRYNMVKYQCSQIENLFTSAAIVFEYNSSITTVINLSLIDDPKTTEANLRLLLQNSNLKGGKSREFNNINNVRNYYIQAFSALEIGKSADSNLYFYNFEDYCLQYMLKNSYQNLIPESLCPSGLIQMNEYDKVHNTQYVLTLKTYFEQKFNVTHAAKKLYIHRTTFIERLSRIKNFIGIDFEDSRECLYLMIALEIMN